MSEHLRGCDLIHFMGAAKCSCRADEISELQRQLENCSTKMSKLLADESRKYLEAESKLTTAEATIERMREALEKIAKPALGGKQQQLWAQKALAWSKTTNAVADEGGKL